MTVHEERFMESIPPILRDIAKQLKLMNKLKVLALQEKFGTRTKSLAEIEKDINNP